MLLETAGISSSSSYALINQLTDRSDKHIMSDKTAIKQNIYSTFYRLDAISVNLPPVSNH